MVDNAGITDKVNIEKNYKRPSILDITHSLEASICSIKPSVLIKKCDKYKERNSQVMLNFFKQEEDNNIDDCFDSSVFDDQNSFCLDKTEKRKDINDT